MSKSSLSLNENDTEKKPPSMAQQSPTVPHYITPPHVLISTIFSALSPLLVLVRWNCGSGGARMLLGLNLSHVLASYHMGRHAFLLLAGFPSLVLWGLLSLPGGSSSSVCLSAYCPRNSSLSVHSLWASSLSIMPPSKVSSSIAASQLRSRSTANLPLVIFR